MDSNKAKNIEGVQLEFNKMDTQFVDRLQSDLNSFIKLSQILKDKTGINLVPNEKNITLMASRLAKVLKRHKLDGYKKYLKLLEEQDAIHSPEFISAMTTNTTRFFREPDHFEVFKRIIPEILDAKKKKHHYELRVWCAASSTGQEVYTLLMLLLDLIPNWNQWSLKFLASDIDLKVLQKAADGIFTAEDVSEVPESYRVNFFNLRKSSQNQLDFQVKSEYREMIRFAPFNLQTAQYPFQHPFDIIFCRNVLIYFDAPTVHKVIINLGNSLDHSGYLFLGHSETGAMRMMNHFQSVSNGVYQKKGDI